MVVFSGRIMKAGINLWVPLKTAIFLTS